VVEQFHVDPEKVSVTYLGAGDEFRERSSASTVALMEYLGLNYSEYFLCVSTIEPRKNIESLIGAYMRMSKATRSRFPLVLAGEFGWHCDELKLRIEGLADEGVKHLGFVSQNVLPLLYSSARCLVYPSFYEGFGLPVLEAQASGIPVVASRTSSIPEVASSKALLVDPDNTDELFQAMSRAAEDQDWRVSCSKAGLEKAKGFSWDRCAEATIGIYKKLDT
jgi:alpha-1,3-rhamnosyl/mannosyltransferase